MIKKLFVFIMGFACYQSGFAMQPAPLTNAPAPTVAARFDMGVFRPDPVVAIYAVADGRKCRGRIVVAPTLCRTILRFFNPEEELCFWQYLEPMPKIYAELGSGEIARMKLVQDNTLAEPKGELADFDVSLETRGVYQIRVSGSAHLKIGFEREVPYGVSFQNGRFSPWNAGIAKTYVFVPPHAEIFKIAGQGVRVLDENGQQVFPTTNQVTVFSIKRTEVVWTFEFPNPKNWHFNAAGFPVILCPTEAAARAIRASVELLPDGTLICHKFQKQIAKIMPQLLAPENVGKTEDLLALCDRIDRKSFLEQPARNSQLLNSYNLFPLLKTALREQNVDPASHWSGSIGAWKDKAGKPPPENRWDRLQAAPGCSSGASSGRADYGNALASAALLDVPFNPFYGRKELLYRAAALALRDLMTMPEHETWLGNAADMNPYPGFMGFSVINKNFPEYSLVAKHMPPHVRDVWTDGLRRIIDRHYPDGIVTCWNQTAHYLAGWQMFALGSDDPRYYDLAKRYAEYSARTARPAGYFGECSGPDATYCGMQHWNMAVYYRLSGDPVMLEAIRKSYTFFNHTVAPEPDGAMFGGCNFSHRTPAGFEAEQYGGAKGILDDVLPEVGLWSRGSKEKPALVEAADLERQPFLKINDLPKACPMLNFSRYRYWTEHPDKSAVWPAMESNAFIRNFGNELIAVKRPGYYTAIYVGHPAGHPFYISGREKMRAPLPDDAENAGADSWKFYYTIGAHAPFNGGGLTLFWTPAYGNAMAAGNFSPLCHHGLVAVDQDGKRWWEDYFATDFTLDPTNSVLVCTGRLENKPLRYTRRYQFADDQVDVLLTLTADANVQFKSLVENIPIVGGEIKKRGALIVAQGETPLQDDRAPQTAPGKTTTDSKQSVAESDQFTIMDNNGQGVKVVFDARQKMTIFRNGMRSGSAQINRIEIALPSVLTKGKTTELHYKIIPQAGAMVGAP